MHQIILYKRHCCMLGALFGPWEQNSACAGYGNELYVTIYFLLLLNLSRGGG